MNHGYYPTGVGRDDEMHIYLSWNIYFHTNTFLHDSWHGLIQQLIWLDHPLPLSGALDLFLYPFVEALIT